MKPTDNALLIKANLKQTLATPAKKPTARSARPMKSMVKVKSIRPQRIDLKGGMRKRSVKL